MKNRLYKIILLLVCFVLSNQVNAHELNAFKYANISQYPTQDNYINDIKHVFEGIGFKIVENETINYSLSDEEKKQMLNIYFSYSNSRSFYSLRLLAITQNGKRILDFTTKGNKNKALRVLSETLTNYNYKYDSTLFEKIEYKSPLSVRSIYATKENAIKYLSEHATSDLEGIYTLTPNVYRSVYPIGQEFAIIKENGYLYAIALDNHLNYNYGREFPQQWKRGQLRFAMKQVSAGTIYGEWYGFGHSPFKNYTGIIENGRLQIINEVGTYKEEYFTRTWPGYGESFKKQAPDPNQPKATGSGFFVAKNIIVTNNHVISDAAKIEISIFEGGSTHSYVGNVLCVDKTNDLALLTIKDKSLNITSIPYNIADSPVDVGTSIFTMGYPLTNYLGDEVKVTDGIISAKNGFQGDVVTYQISAPIQPGNSGGALFDKNGHLIGVTNAGIPGAENVGYAIKSSYVINLIKSAPIDISLPVGRISNKTLSLAELVKLYKPFIVTIKIY